jgi:hypothetical protein
VQTFLGDILVWLVRTNYFFGKIRILAVIEMSNEDHNKNISDPRHDTKNIAQEKKMEITT